MAARVCTGAEAPGRRFRYVAGACALALVLGIGAGCTGGGSGGSGAGSGGFEGTGTGGDDRGGGGPGGTGSVPHVEIIHEPPGGDPAMDVVPDAGDLGG